MDCKHTQNLKNKKEASRKKSLGELGELFATKALVDNHYEKIVNLVPDRKPPFSKKNRDPLKFGEEFYRKKYDMDDIHKINTISFKN